MKHAPLLLAFLALAACATLQPQQPIDPKILAEFSKPGIPPVVADKVRDGAPLAVEDVAACAKAGVPGPGLVSYMQGTRKAYNLTRADLAKLRAAGTPEPVINYMRRSQGYYAKGPKAVNQNHPYFATENYHRHGDIRAPFAYAPPQIATFFNTGYEESLYSPFSAE